MPSLKLSIAAFAVTGLALGACTNPDGSANRTGTGAAVGGVLGAATGALVSGNSARGAVVGGLLGAGGGALVGNVLDRQAADLQRDIGASGARIVNDGNRLTVSLPEAITFATESAVVRSSIQDDILAIANNLQQYPNNTVQVIGHTDNTGSTAFNQNLSERRAGSVANILRQGGVPSSRIVAFGLGENQPIASNASVDGRAQNRRVEIVITPN